MDSNFYSNLLNYIEQNNFYSSLDYSKLGFQEHSEALLSLKSLQSFGNLFKISVVKRAFWSLTEKGKVFLRNYKQDSMQNAPDIEKIFYVLVNVENENKKSVDESLFKECEQNNYITKTEMDCLEVTKGDAFTDNLLLANDLTGDMISSKSWKQLVLSTYDYYKIGIIQKSGALHVIYDFIIDVREALFQLGFKEAHVTNYLENYSKVDIQKNPLEESDIYNVHTGNSDEEPDSKSYHLRNSLFNFLLSHTANMKSVPSKLFTIGKVFSNRNIDSLNLPEYHSLEMMISDIDLDLSNILGICMGLFSRLNITYTDFKQAYFPYTSPTVGIYLYNEVLDSWMSVGKGGIVRPEVMKKLGYNDSMFILRLELCLERVLLNKKETDDMNNLLRQNKI